MELLSKQDQVPSTTGIVLHRAWTYDAFLWLASFGKEHDYRERVLDLAKLRPGEVVLDIGCGTGTLAIAAKRRVGASGSVYGVDASKEMLARATKKAMKAGTEIGFRNGVVEALPFGNGEFDAVLSTMMMHHIGPKSRLECAREVRRVLKPGGRVVVVDFAKPAPGKKGLLDHFHHHGYVKVEDLIRLLSEAGLNTLASGAMGIGDLKFVLASTAARA